MSQRANCKIVAARLEKFVSNPGVVPNRRVTEPSRGPISFCSMTDPTDLIAPRGLHFGPLGGNWVHLCIDMQRLFAEQTQ